MEDSSLNDPARWFDPIRVLRIKMYVCPSDSLDTHRSISQYKVFGYDSCGKEVYVSIDTPSNISDARKKAIHVKEIVERHHPCTLETKVEQVKTPFISPANVFANIHALGNKRCTYEQQRVNDKYKR